MSVRCFFLIAAATAAMHYKRVALIDQHQELGGAGINTGTCLCNDSSACPQDGGSPSIYFIATRSVAGFRGRFVGVGRTAAQIAVSSGR